MRFEKVAYVLALYAKEKHLFHDQEMRLLTALAGDIGFAINHMETQQRFDYLAYFDALTGLANRNLFLAPGPAGARSRCRRPASRLVSR